MLEFEYAKKNQSKTNMSITKLKFLSLKKLTVIIPTYNRQHFLLRQTTYWANSGAKLILIDGSPKPLKSNLQRILKKSGDIKYIHSNTSVSDRLAKAGKYITTPYAVTLNDDDFILMSGACDAIKVLDKYSDVVACRGQSIHALLSNEKTRVKFSFFYNQFKNFNVDQEKIENRIMYAFQNYNGAASFAVMRTHVWKKSWAEGYDDYYSSTNISEISQNLTTYIFGKLLCLPIPYTILTNEIGSVHTSSDNRSLFFVDWWNSNQYRRQKTFFLSRLSKLILKKEVMDRDKSIELIIRAIEVYLNVQNTYSFSGDKLIGPKVTKQFIRNFKMLFKYTGTIWVYDYLKSRFIERSVTSKFTALREINKLNLKSGVHISKSRLYEIEQVEKMIIGLHPINPS